MKAATDEDTRFELSSFERWLADRPRPRWLGWRMRLLVLATLLGCLLPAAMLRSLIGAPQVELLWTTDAAGRVVLAASRDPALQDQVGTALVGLAAAGADPVGVDPALLQRSARWMIDDTERAELIARRAALASALGHAQVSLLFADGSSRAVKPQPRTVGQIPLPFWLLAALALGVYLVGAIVLLARPSITSGLYAVMAGCQAAALLTFAVEAVAGLGATPMAGLDTLAFRLGLDLATAAAAVHVCALSPRTLALHRALAVAVWALAALATLVAWAPSWPQPWWWAQGLTLALGLLAVAVLTRSYRLEPNPLASILRRVSLVALGTLALVLGVIATADRLGGVPFEAAATAGVIWYVFFASLLVLVPFLSQARQLLREFALLAGLSTVATTLDLLFVSVFSLGQFTSLTLAVFLALAAYAGARQWVFSQVLGKTLVTTEKTFEQLYRTARELRLQPERYHELLKQLLRDLFDPVELLDTARPSSRARVIADGAALVVPLRAPDETEPARVSAVLRYAHGGKRMFSHEDARLAERVAEQLHRAVLFDQAVEQGRTEERMRLAQDLHDDIGARLLTLMYKAETQEVEDYVRHTLQDLKTLTRGLATSEHRLGHSLAEWKADIQQRLEAAGIELVWRFEHDSDPVLSVVQWSGLTRVLRELVSNTIHHAHATRVDIDGRLRNGEFNLSVCDDGSGQDPGSWSHGLGLGGVRKRVKLLGGSVAWRERQGRGIACEVSVPLLPGPAS